MPSAKPKKKPVMPVAPTPEPTPEVSATFNAVPVGPDGTPLPVFYDKLDITEYSINSPAGPLTVEDQKNLLWWETESEYQARMVKERPGSKPEHWLFGDVFHCKNVAGEKVRCHKNAQNRPFDMAWCEDLIHTILYGQWAGPATVPGGTVNGETIRISKYARVLSGQHQMTACVLADEWLHKAREQLGIPGADAKYPHWAMTKPGQLGTHTFLETIVITGMSEDPRVLISVDYVKPRSAADVFYTSEVFKTAKVGDRKELCRLLAGATDFLWTRTATRGYKTHPELVAFLERHKRLLDCVLHIYAENNAASASGRKLSNLRLHSGQCAALMFVMASSGPDTDGDVYRNEEPPSEKNLDWSYWNRAEQFWTLLAGGRDFITVRTALSRLTDSAPHIEDNPGLGGRGPEKLAILAKAWERWKDHPASAGVPFDDSDLEDGGLLSLEYVDIDDKGRKLPDGRIKLVDVADFYGIDVPEVITTKTARNAPPEPPPPSREEFERATEAARERRQQNS